MHFMCPLSTLATPSLPIRSQYLFSSNFAATVVCKQLGFGGGTPYSWTQLAARGYNNSLVQPAGMPRGPSQLQVCYGDEPTLLDCEWTANDVFNCPTSNSVAGVFCTRQAPPPSPPAPPPSPPPYWSQTSCSRNYDIRFVDGPNPTAGRVEVCYNGEPTQSTACGYGRSYCRSAVLRLLSPSVKILSTAPAHCALTPCPFLCYCQAPGVSSAPVTGTTLSPISFAARLWALAQPSVRP